MSLCRPVVRLPPNAAFFEAIFWCSAPQNFATRQPLHVSISVSSPRDCPHPAQVSRPRCTRHERCSLRCASAASSWPAPKARCASCKLANGRPPSKTAWSHFAASRSRRSRSLVSTSNRALPSCADAKGEGDTHVERCLGLPVCKLQRCCQGMLCFQVADGFDVLVQVHVASAEVPARPALPHPVTHLLQSINLLLFLQKQNLKCNRQTLRLVREALLKSPCDRYAHPRSPPATNTPIHFHLC